MAPRDTIIVIIPMADGGAFGLSRVATSHTIDCGGDLKLRLSVAVPLDKRGPPSFVIYVLDPEPELFALVTAHLFGRFGYVSSENDPEASLMRRAAVVGVGHDPSLYNAGAYGFSVEALRDLRRKHFRDDIGGFMEILIDTVVPYSEATVLGMADVVPRRLSGA